MEETLYKIIKAGSFRELERLVREEMLRDWKPQGGIATDKDGFYQAMIPCGD
jgi:hypothetical protein